jgi:Mrp family chromosome partitioning ATPase
MSIFEFGNIDGVLFITSPSKESILDTRRSIGMCQQFGLHELGIVENMSGGVFGKDKALSLASEFSIPYLGSIPLNNEIFETNERAEIAFLLPGMEDAVRDIIDAVKGDLN